LGPTANGQYDEFFPGHLYVDTIAVDTRFRTDSVLKLMGNGKVLGLFLTGVVPDPAFFAQQPDWAWFIFAPDSTDHNSTTTDQSQVVRRLYDDPRLISRAR
jgi:hypothetical protein